MRGMLKTYDELESTNDLACSGYMLNNNSNNNAIHLECLLSTHVWVWVGVGVCVCVCVCVCARNPMSCLPSLASKLSHEPCWLTHEKTSQGMHQGTGMLCAALSAPHPACLNLV